MMIKKYRSPGGRAWGHEEIKEVEFERETDKCLFDSRGNRTLKVSDWCIYHDTIEQAQAHLHHLKSDNSRRISEERIRKAAPALLEALELALAELIEKAQVIQNEFGGGEKITAENLDNGDKYLAAIAAAKGGVR